jgi:hypothetical protein
MQSAAIYTIVSKGCFRKKYERKKVLDYIHERKKMGKNSNSYIFS